jgi:hypothetical protein
MCDNWTVKEVLLGKPDGRRRTEIPKLMSLDCADNDLQWVDGCPGMEEEGRTQISMGCHSEGGTSEP